MKKTLIIGALLVGSLSAYSQGNVTYADRLSDVTLHIFAPQLLTPGLEVTGDQGLATGTAVGGVAADIYANNTTDGNYAGGSVAQAGVAGTFTTGGSQVYTGGAIGNTAAGFATPAGLYNFNNGSDYTVQLWAAGGSNNAPLSALSPVTQYTSVIYTSATLGGAFHNVSTFSGGDPGIPNSANGLATIALVCWYNGGVGLTYAAALAAGDPTGISPLDNIAALGNVGSPSNPTPDMEGLESFSLAEVTPEPSTIALGVIGAGKSGDLKRGHCPVLTAQGRAPATVVASCMTAGNRKRVKGKTGIPRR